MKLSKKKETELYESIHKEIMDARIKIQMRLKGMVHRTILNEVDDVMSDLTIKAPLNAIRIFNPDAK